MVGRLEPGPRPRLQLPVRRDVRERDQLLRGRQRVQRRRPAHADRALGRHGLGPGRQHRSGRRRPHAQRSVVRERHFVLRGRRLPAPRARRGSDDPDTDRTLERNQVVDRRRPEPVESLHLRQRAQRRDVHERDELLRVPQHRTRRPALARRRRPLGRHELDSQHHAVRRPGLQRAQRRPAPTRPTASRSASPGKIRRWQ